MTRRRIAVWIGLFAAAVIGGLVISRQQGLIDYIGRVSLYGSGATPRAIDKPERDPNAPPNVILISVDTLRADRLGCYGYDRPTSPTIDGLAERGVRFENVIAESSWTLPSHVTMFTGLLPSAHGVTHPSHQLASEIPTLAEILREEGYRTAGYCGGGYVRRQYGFGRGFETYNDQDKDLRLTLSLGLRQIDRFKNEPYFLFLHDYDVHCPYDPEPEYAARFRTTPPKDHLYTTGMCPENYFNKLDLSPGQVQFLSDQYDAGIRQADDDIEHFLHLLAQRDALDNTIIVFVSDHGEAFNEHGKIGHGGSYIEVLKVPMIFVAPGLEPRVVSKNVGLADLAPTLLDMLGIDAPPVQGKSLMPLMEGVSTDWPERSLLSEHYEEQKSIVQGQWHYIRKVAPDGTTTEELFDLAADPTEQHNLAAEQPELAREMAGILSARLEEAVTHSVSRQPLAEKELQQLRSLGYLR